MMDWEKQIERYFGRWTWLHLIVGAVVLATVLAGIEVYVRAIRPFPLAETVDAQGKDYLRRWLPRTMSEGFIEVAPPPPDKKGSFTTAWIAGSDVIVRPAPSNCRLNSASSRYDLPMVLGKRIERVDGQPFRSESYYQNSLGMGDVRRTVHYVIESQPPPNLIIISLNPIVTFNDYILYGQESRQRPGGLFMNEARSFDWAYMIPVLRPSELALEALAQGSEAIRQRGFVTKLDSLVETARFPYSPDNDGSHSARPANLVAMRRAKLPLSDSQRAFDLLFAGELGQDGVAARYLYETLIDIRASGIPTVLYIPPINTIYDDNASVAERMKMIEDRIAQIVKMVQAPNIMRDLAFWREVARPIPFRDRIHITCGRTVVDRVVDLMSKAIDGEIIALPNDRVYEPIEGGTE